MVVRSQMGAGLKAFSENAFKSIQKMTTRVNQEMSRIFIMEYGLGCQHAICCATTEWWRSQAPL